MKYIKYLMILTCVIFVSCEYDIDYKEDLPKDKLVVGFFMEEGDSVSFLLSHSARPGVLSKSGYTNIKNRYGNYDFGYWKALVYGAKAELYNKETSYSETVSTNKSPMYKFNYIPKHNDNLLLTLKADGYPTAKADIRFNLTAPVIDSFQCTYRTKDYNNELIVYLEIRDDGQENYYMLYPYDMDSTGWTNLTINPKILYESHVGVFKEQDNQEIGYDDDYKYNFQIFSNKKFAGEKYIIKLAYSCQSFNQNKPNLKKGNFKVCKIDKKSYDYLYSFAHYMNSTKINMNPITIADGIDGAYGFAGVKKTTILRLSSNK